MASNDRPMLDHVQDLASYLKDDNANLDWLWLDVRNNIIDTMTRTIALSLFTSIAVAVLYIVISRKWRDYLVALILIFILPDWLTAFGVWLGMLSRLAQQYSWMHANILDTGVTVAKITACIQNSQCDDPYTLNSKPAYTAHGCVGTTIAAANPMIHASMACFAAVVFLLGNKRLGWVNGSLLFVPLLAACGSAVMHVRRVCFPAPIVVGRLRLVTGWEVSNPRGIDVTTARLSLLARIVPLLLVISHLWEARHELQVLLRDGPARRRWTYWLVVTYVLPVCVNNGWRALRSAYAGGPYASVLQYTFFSAGDALLVPLMIVYPGLALLVRRLYQCDSDAESKVMPDPEKSDALAPAGDTKSDETAP